MTDTMTITIAVAALSCIALLTAVLVLRARLRVARAAEAAARVIANTESYLHSKTTAERDRARELLAQMTANYDEAHHDRQQLLAEVGAHRAVKLAGRIPGLTEEERRAIRAKLEDAQANSPKVRVR
jgi:hypothetical protein